MISLYPKLAANGIKKNAVTYLPYILTCSGMIMMYYIISFLTLNDMMDTMEGGQQMRMILFLGCGIIIVFSAVFLFYTNSFLVRRRKKEFGLFNILGMGKRNIAVIMIWESLMVYVLSMAIGIGCGILFSKLAQLLFANIIGTPVNYVFSVETESIIRAAIYFAVIFALILANALRQVHLSDPIELLRSENTGEKPPKSNIPSAVIGVILLAIAYYMAVTIKEPLKAMLFFFAAVIMVIAATYLLFVAGSVVFCRLLKRNKNYYYKPNHFVSVSQMVYRMKRSGAGLASICILSTMVLVTLSATICLYTGENDIIKHRYPREVTVSVYSADEKIVNNIKDIAKNAAKETGAEISDEFSYRYYYSYCTDRNGQFDPAPYISGTYTGYDIYFIPIEDYNAYSGNNITLEKGQAMIYYGDQKLKRDTIPIIDICSFDIIGEIDDPIINGSAVASITSAIFIFTDSPDTLYMLQKEIAEKYDGTSHVSTYFGFDIDGTSEQKTDTAEKAMDNIVSYTNDLERNETYGGFMLESRELNRIDFFSMYGGLFFLGILLGSVFIIAAALIMYYKQISEGYEDRKRFEILRKVGMTKHDIRRSINSQVLTVFFMPLAAAGIHTAFAFPIISRILRVFGMTNTILFAKISLLCYGVFALLYILVYFATSHSYYRIAASDSIGEQ